MAIAGKIAGRFPCSLGTSQKSVGVRRSVSAQLAGASQSRNQKEQQVPGSVVNESNKRSPVESCWERAVERRKENGRAVGGDQLRVHDI